MPLKLVKPRKGKTPYWSVRGTYLGRYVDRSTKSRKRTLAGKILKAWERSIERGAYTDRHEITFAQAATAYMKAGGERTYLRKLLEHFGETPVSQISQASVDSAAMGLYPNASAATHNRQVYTPITAVLIRAGERPNLRRPRGSSGNKQTAWLWPEEAFALIAEAKRIDKEFAALLIVLCYTGMRLSEALGLTWNNVRLEDGYAYVPQTKNDEPRAVFLPPVAVAALANTTRERNRVFKFSKSGHLYSLLKVGAFRAGVDLPERSAFHIFRRTYATWMRRYAGLDEVGLLAIGAWKDMKSVHRYSQTIVSEEAKRAALLPTPGWRSRGK